MPGKSKRDLVLYVACVARSGGADSLIRSLNLSRVGERKVCITADWAAHPTADIVGINGL
jgi:PP-loop superfamily ATP-utilizing enzyme